MKGKRSKARQLAAQALYQWQMTAQDAGGIEREFLSERDLAGIDRDYFKDLLLGVPRTVAALDGRLEPLLDRPIPQIDPVERAILRLGTYELIHHPEIPYRVVINEAIELAKIFGATEGHKYVNGVLDRLAKQLRVAETTGSS